jgi:glycosyltransferase involved in cell wall biosynthesis
MKLDSLILYRDFLEDRRTSMEVYSDNLESSLKNIASDRLVINSYTPSIPNWIIKCKLPHGVQIRYSRYFSYLHQAKNHQGDINHIVDQSYGHLLNLIDTKRTVITVHDLIPILAWKGVIPGLSYPHYPLFYKLAVSSLKKARAIIAVSHSTKEDLIRYCGVSASSITVVYNGIDSRYHPVSPDSKAALRKSFGLPSEESHVVLITGNQSYKNHLTSFKVISRLQSIITKPVQLVWLGADTVVKSEYQNKYNIHNDVICLTNLSTERLNELYNSIDCLLFPSWYEGFGWPPLEAMACGTPVVTSNVASLLEIVGDAAITESPDDVDRLTSAVKTMLEDKILRCKYVKRGFTNTSRFTWDKCALDVLSIYRKII